MCVKQLWIHHEMRIVSLMRIGTNCVRNHVVFKWSPLNEFFALVWMRLECLSLQFFLSKITMPPMIHYPEGVFDYNNHHSVTCHPSALNACREAMCKDPNALRAGVHACILEWAALSYSRIQKMGRSKNVESPDLLSSDGVIIWWKPNKMDNNAAIRQKPSTLITCQCVTWTVGCILWLCVLLIWGLQVLGDISDQEM